MLRFLKAYWNNGLTIATALVLGLLLLCLSTSAPADVTYSAQAVKWFDNVNVDGALTVADGITVTAGGIDFPATSVSLGDLQYDVVALGPNIHTVCPSGCDYTSIRSALSGHIGSAASPNVVLVAPGTYTDTSSGLLGTYEYVIGYGAGTTVWVLNNRSLSVSTPSGLYNITVEGGSSDDVYLVNVDGGTSTFWLDHTRLLNTASTPGMTVLFDINGTLDAKDSYLDGGGSGEAALTINNGTAKLYDTVVKSTNDRAVNIAAAATAEFYRCILESTSDYGIEVTHTGAILDVMHTILQVGGAESVHVTSAMTATICLSPMSAGLDADLANDCTNPCNPVLP